VSEFLIDDLENRPEAPRTIASWVWREWGFGSVADCSADLSQSQRESIPSRFVAISATGDPVGIVNLIECNLPPRCDLRPWLAGLYVHPRHRRRGIGSALVRHCEAAAADLGVRSLYLWTARTEEFYRRLGWVTIDTHIWERETVAIMRRALG
jgi:N-acetylglutamate synthase-like GNAT family acetyltransferase